MPPLLIAAPISDHKHDDPAYDQCDGPQQVEVDPAAPQETQRRPTCRRRSRRSRWSPAWPRCGGRAPLADRQRAGQRERMRWRSGKAERDHRRDQHQTRAVRIRHQERPERISRRDQPACRSAPCGASRTARASRPRRTGSQRRCGCSKPGSRTSPSASTRNRMTATASAWPSPIGRSASQITRSLRRLSPSATANSHPIAGLMP